MIYARQIAPEYQQSEFGMGLSVYEGVIFSGNDRVFERTTPEFDRVVESIDCHFMLGRIGGWNFPYNTLTELVNDLFPRHDGKSYAPRQVHKWKQLIEWYSRCDTSAEKDIFCEALGLMTGIEYDYTCIRGCSQSEWQYIYYPVKDYGDNALEIIEKDFWNLGSEWIFIEGETEPESPSEIGGADSCVCYCYDWEDDGIRRELADAAGVSPESVIMFKFDGYARAAKYERVCG